MPNGDGSWGTPCSESMDSRIRSHPLVAVDTNVPLDLVRDKDHVIEAIETVQRRLTRCVLVVPPSVMQELAFIAVHGDTPVDCQTADEALAKLLQWKMQPANLVPVGHGIAEQIALDIRRRNLLPDDEVHDALILAESALLKCAILLTSDEHLRGIDFERLVLALRQFDVEAPIIASPKKIVQRFFR